ncbi:MAG: hypothetical protein ABIR96_03235 [Bdellovibrionota bacterium]
MKPLDGQLNTPPQQQKPNPENPIAGLVQTLEQSAAKIVDSVEQKAMDALSSVEGRVGGFDKKAAEVVGSFEEKAISAVEHIDEIPAFIDRSVRSNPFVAIGIGFGVGAAARLALYMLPTGSVRSAAKIGGGLLAKNAASWAVQALSQKRV